MNQTAYAVVIVKLREFTSKRVEHLADTVSDSVGLGGIGQVVDKRSLLEDLRLSRHSRHDLVKTEGANAEDLGDHRQKIRSHASNVVAMVGLH